MNILRKRYEYKTTGSDEDLSGIDGKKDRDRLHTVPLWVPFLILAVLLGLFLMVQAIDNKLPVALSLKDEKDNPKAFIAERARHDLKLLTDLGPRVVGSDENEILAFEYIKREIHFINQTAHKAQRLELATQIVSGAYNLSGGADILAYANVQNIAVKLHGKSNSNVSLLVNAHFDSVPTSPGGSDDGINCAVMLEILRKMSRESTRSEHNVIFLFNGAEETRLQAAHGFITQHRWANDTKVVLNLEAAGAEGKIILFQSGPAAPWLIDYYSRVPHPYGQASGEEIFQSGIIPSDTDFRIFRDYGGLLGLDMAFFKQGYRYHTKYDDFEHIPEGSFQHVGDNALALVRELSNAPELYNPKENPSKVVFFDVLGLFMVSYTQVTAAILNYSTVVLSLGVAVWSMRGLKLNLNGKTAKYYGITIGAIFAGWILSAVVVLAIAYFLDSVGYAMSWYRNPWLVFGLYVIPAIGSLMIFIPFINHNVTSANVKAQVQAHIIRIIWSLVLLIGTIFNIRTMYAVLIPVLFNTIGFIIIILLNWQFSRRKWIVVYLISQIIPAIMIMYAALLTLGLFIPITGRIGSDKNSDAIIGAMALIFTILIFSPLVALANLVKQFKYFIAILGLFFVISFVIVFTPLGFPYSGNKDAPAAQRQWILHIRRVIRSENGTEINRDAGYFLLNMDRNSPGYLKKYVTDLSRVRSLESDCDQYLLCGLPLQYSKMMDIVRSGSWIPAGQPLLPETTRIDVLNRKQVSKTRIQYDLSIRGPDRMALYISPKIAVNITEISIIPERPHGYVWNGRKIYFLGYICGKQVEPLKLTLEVETAENFTGMTTELGVGGIFVHDSKNRNVPHFTKFLNEFPDWADVTAWLGSFENVWI